VKPPKSLELAIVVGLSVGAGCGSSGPSGGPVTGCPALASCCNASRFPASRASECAGTLNAGIDVTCDELLTEYEVDGYCGSGNISVLDGGGGSLGADCAELLTCCSEPTFTGNLSDCNAQIYADGGAEPGCYSLLTTYMNGGKCGASFDAGVIPQP